MSRRSQWGTPTEYAAATAQCQQRVQEALNRDKERFQSLGRCWYPLTELGWIASGLARWSPPSQMWNDDYLWWLPAVEEIGLPEINMMRGDIWCEDSNIPVPPPGLCGEKARKGKKFCHLHKGLPYENMNPKAWERVSFVVTARQEADLYTADAWASTVGEKRLFWAGHFG